MRAVGAIVIGAGVVGLAVGRALAMAGLETVIVEGESHFGTWTSARNSEVIHAGIYYPKGSLKASLCVEGRHELYAYCRARDLPHRQCGKLIFAHTANETGELDKIARSAVDAGVDDLVRLSGAEVSAMEPALKSYEALLSPSTGIVDSHSFMQSLLADAEAHGAIYAADSAVTRISRQKDGWAIHVGGDDEPVVVAPFLVNSAGLAAHAVAGMVEGLDTAFVPPLHYARGVYFSYSGASPFSRLIYPVPEPGGLGTHLTLDLAGQIRFGPDVEWISGIDYKVDPNRHGKFYAAARRIWPEIDPDRLRPGFAGIRPKLSGPGEPAADFVISGEGEHGLFGLVNLFGIESPGLTSALAIGRVVHEMLLSDARVAA